MLHPFGNILSDNAHMAPDTEVDWRDAFNDLHEQHVKVRNEHEEFRKEILRLKGQLIMAEEECQYRAKGMWS